MGVEARRPAPLPEVVTPTSSLPADSPSVVLPDIRVRLVEEVLIGVKLVLEERLP